MFTDGRIVRAQVQLASCNKLPCTAKSEPLKLPKPSEVDDKEGFNLTYSYTVEFIVSDIKVVVELVYISLLIMQENERIQWASRWDHILSSVPPQINYPLSVSIYTIFIILFLSFHAALIIHHSLHPSKEQVVRKKIIICVIFIV